MEKIEKLIKRYLVAAWILAVIYLISFLFLIPFDEKNTIGEYVAVFFHVLSAFSLGGIIILLFQLYLKSLLFQPTIPPPTNPPRGTKKCSPAL